MHSYHCSTFDIVLDLLEEENRSLQLQIEEYDKSIEMERRPWILCNEMVKAIQEKKCDAVKKLLNEGFDVDTELMFRKYPIVICIESDSLEIGELFIHQGCSLSLKTTMGNTPLHVAVELSNFNFVKLLLNNRADSTSIDDNGRTALHRAAQMNSLRMVKLLMEKSTRGVLNIMDSEGKTPFNHACCHGSKSLISYFLDQGCNVNAEYGPLGDTPLLSAISNHLSSSDMINILLNAGAKINHTNKSGETPLLIALHQLAVNNFSGATYRQFQNVCCLLIDRGSEVNVRNILSDTPLHLAVSLNDEMLVRKLLNSGSLVNATNDLGFSPLFYACRKEMQRITALLVDSGANLRHLSLFIHEHQLWVNRRLKNSCSVLNYLIQKSKECQNLQNSCRLVIRKNLPRSIEKSALLLPLPIVLIRFIQLVD